MKMNKNTRIIFNKNLSNLIEKNCLENTPFKKNHFLASSLFILLHEIINQHNQYNNFTIVSNENKITINLNIFDILCRYNDIGGSSELKKEFKRVISVFNIIEFINANYSSIINIQEDSIILDKKHFLVNGNFKIKENKVIKNYQYSSYKKLYKFKKNIFKEIYSKNPKSIRKLLITLTTGFLFSFSKKDFFKINDICISEDIIITRVKQLQDKYLNYLRQLGAIKDFYYETINNCYKIAQDYIIDTKKNFGGYCKTFNKKAKQLALHIFKNNYIENLIHPLLKNKLSY